MIEESSVCLWVILWTMLVIFIECGTQKKELHNTRDVIRLKRMHYTRQLRDNEVEKGTVDKAQPGTIEHNQENKMVGTNEDTV